MANLNTGIIRRLPFAYPPITEQRRIAAILDQADALRAKRREALAELDGLAQAIFVEMFGDAFWDSDNQVNLGQIADIITGFAFRSDEYVMEGDRIRLCRGTNVLPGRIDWADLACWPTSKSSGIQAFSLAEGDIVLAMDRPWISEGFKIAKISAADCPSLLVQRVARIRANSSNSTEFIYMLLKQEKFARHCKPTETTIPHISPKEIRSFSFKPPSASQLHIFSIRIQAIESLKATHRTALTELDALFASLQHRAFRGEL